MSIQILQYEFLGPIMIDQWGPPMEKTVYLILGRDKDSFRILYAGDCEKTDDKGFLVNHSAFKCWVDQAGSEKSLYIAILPLFEDPPDYRKHILGKIIQHYKPTCNDRGVPEPPPYTVRKDTPTTDENPHCLCCGAVMKIDKVLEKTTILRCTSCGISDTRLNS